AFAGIRLSACRTGFEPLQTVGGLVERRVDPERLAEVGNGARFVGQPLADQSASRESAGRTGVERNRAVGVRPRLYAFTAEIVRPSSVVIGERSVGGNLDDAGIIRYGVGELEAIAFGVAAIDIGVGEPRIELDGLIEISHGPPRLTLGDPGAAAVVVGCCSWVQSDGLIVVGDRAVEIAFVPPSHASVVECRRVAW